MKTMMQFLEEYELVDEYNEWLNGIDAVLTEGAFIDFLKGMNGSTPLLPPFEKFWISVFGKYIVEEDDTTGAQPDLVITKIVIPNDIFIDSTTKVHTFISGSVNTNILVNSSTGFVYCNYEDYDDISGGTVNNSTLTLSTSESYVRNFAGLTPEQRMYVRAGSLLEFRYESEPTEDTEVSLTFAASKLRDISSDTTVIKGISGYFKLKDNNLGVLTEVGFGMAPQESIVDFSKYSNSLGNAYTNAQRGFTESYDIQFKQTGYAGVFNVALGTLTIKNNSKIARVLTLTPFDPINLDSEFTGKFLPKNLINNATAEGGSIVIELTANQGD